MGDVPLPENLAPETSVEKRQVTTADFSRVQQQVNRFVKKHGAEKVLLVVDIDNTLLAMNQDLGSDQWFSWQESLLENDPANKDLVADTFEELLRAQGMLFALSEMHPPEPDLPAMLKQIQASDVTTIVLTSRGPEFRDAAQRELGRNGYDFSLNNLSIREQRGNFKPYDFQRPDKHGLSIEIIAALGIKPRDVTYANGIYMTSGQHKGYMLKTLLARTTNKVDTDDFKAIVFADDHPKHVVGMQEAFEDDEIDVATFRYSREDGNVANFNQSSKQHAAYDWKRLHEFIGRVLVR
ncbi:DUF2608 domain-containing protein [Rubripirellula obstinata]|uniref:DUF2608 domain-containing protein n=1 Tax=Rubripirellula obstinata TaxID=406547 RepID=UPI00135A8612|nr:DUF2608 domain-containing protein [Rubripirellula obstinata]